jgi:hypothetical protein
MRQGVDPVKQLGETDVTHLYPSPTNLYGGTADQMRGLALQRPHEIVSGDPTDSVDSAERLVGEVPLSLQQTLRLADRAVKGEVFEALQGVLGHKGMDRSFGRQDPARLSDM